MESTPARALRRAAEGAGALALLAVAAPAQVEVGRWNGTTFLAGYGSRLADVGDLDGDGIHDWLAGEEGANTSAALLSGRAELRSGATGALLRDHLGPGQAAGFGSDVAALGDVDGDGVGDYAIGASGWYVGSIPDAGRIELYSGATGGLLLAFDGGSKLQRLGHRITPHADADGDGFPDLLATGSSIPYARVHSSATGQQIRALAIGGNTVSDAAQLDDVDGDGVRDVAVACNRYSGALIDEGRVYVFSGATGATLAVRDGAASQDHLGHRLVTTGDHDGDGLRDLLVTSGIDPQGGGPFAGRVELRSSATFAVLRTYNGAAGEYLGANLASGGDWDGDGVEEHFLVAPVVLGLGAVRVHSGATGALLHEFVGEYLSTGHDHEFGSGVLPGDFDGDGDGDVLIGAQGWHDADMEYEGIVHLFHGCRALRIAYGAGFPGTLLTPALAASDEAGLGATIQLTADNSLGAATTGILVVGPASDNQLLRNGATLWVDVLAVEPIVLPATGWVDTVMIPADPLLCGVDFFLQVFELDPGAGGGISSTQGLQLRVGFDY